MPWLYLYRFEYLPLDHLARASCKLGDWSSFVAAHQNNDHIFCTNQRTLHSSDFAEALLSNHQYLSYKNSIIVDIIVKRNLDSFCGVNQKTQHENHRFIRGIFWLELNIMSAELPGTMSNLVPSFIILARPLGFSLHTNIAGSQ